MHQVRQFLFFIAIFIASLCAEAQQPIFHHLSVEEDLPFKKIYSSIIGSNGFLLIGTEKGVFRFDGIEFHLLHMPFEDEILYLQKESADHIFAITLSNSVYRIQNDSVKLLVNGSIIGRNYVQLVKYGDQLFLNGDKQYLKRYHLKSNKLDSVKLGSKRDENNINNATPLIIAENRFYVYLSQGDSTGIFSFDLPTFSNKQFVLAANSADESKPITFNNDLYFFNQSKNELLKIEKNNSVSKINQLNVANSSLKKRYRFSSSNSDNLLVMSDKGLEVYDNNFQLTNEFLPNNFITGANLNNKVLWVSTLSNGLYVFPNYEAVLIKPKSSRTEEQSLRKLHLYESNILAKSINGSIFYLNQGTLKPLISIPYTNENNYPLKNFKNDTFIYPYTSTNYFIYKDGKKLRSTSTPASIGNKDRSSLGNFSLGSLHFGAIAVTPIDQQYLFSSLLPASMHDKVVVDQLKKTAEITLSETRSNRNLIHSEDSSIWIATAKELLRITKHGIDTLKNNGNPFRIFELKQGQENAIWYNTRNALYKYTSAQQEVFTVADEEELKDFCFSGNFISVCTNKSVYQIDKKGNVIQKFSALDGLPRFEFNSAVVTGQTIHVSGKNGLAIVPIAHYKDSSNKLKVWLEEVKVNDKTINKTNETQLFKYNENNFEISVAALALNSLDYRTIHYRMIGADKNWIKTSSAKQIRYPNLQNGDYTFEVFVDNGRNQQSTVKQFSFSISPPFWKRWWFILLSILLISGIAYLIFNQRIKRIQKEKDLSNRLIQSEIDGLKAQMNPHFIFNSLNSIQDLIISEDIPNSNLYLGKFADLLRMVLDYSSQKSITIKEEVVLLSTYLKLENLRFEDNLNTSIEVESDHIKNFKIPPLLIQPYVENSLKHGLLHSEKETKSISISFYSKDGFVCCCIEDNGVGREMSNKINQRREKYHKSFATSAIEKRIDLINETQEEQIEIEIIDLTDGTKVELRFPL